MSIPHPRFFLLFFLFFFPNTILLLLNMILVIRQSNDEWIQAFSKFFSCQYSAYIFWECSVTLKEIKLSVR